MRNAAMSVLRNIYPLYRPILSRLGLLRYIARKYPSDKRLHEYIEHYEQHFRPWRGKKLKLLEIGIGGHNSKKGGESLKMWRDYFRNGEIYGLDLYDKSFLQQSRITILQCDQNDPVALTEVAKRHGPFDIIIDDGSHISEHIITSYRALYPHLQPNGLYVIEDLYLSYEEKDHGGSTVEFNDPRTANGFLKTLVEEMHWKYIPGYECKSYGKQITGMCFYRKICFIQKSDNSGLDPYLQRAMIEANPTNPMEMAAT